ncbi:MAG TPA: flagellar protein FlaG [Cellvibrio sp.]|nr:flagellar protein FlaG [Cellvibrio sp.]
MNNITQHIGSADMPKPVLASVVSAGSKVEKSGNTLPPDTQAAKVDVVDPQQFQQNVEAAVAQMNEFIQSTQRDLHFSYDRDAGETVVKVLDRETQEVIRQIPDETFLKLARDKDFNGGLQLLNAQA